MKFELEEYHRNVTDSELIADLKRVVAETGKSPTVDEYNERGEYNASTLARRFGKWTKALELAGLEQTRSPINIPNEELFANLEGVWTKLGRQPKYEEMRAPFSKYSSGTYERRFGTWRKALENFVEYVNKIENVSSEEANENLAIEPTIRHKTKSEINWRLRFIVMRRDNFKCQSCGKSPANEAGVILHVDHKKAWATGGETTFENLQTLCSVCNVGKSNLT